MLTRLAFVEQLIAEYHWVAPYRSTTALVFGYDRVGHELEERRDR
jgi:hypothetical protein